jgi:bacterioferritin-associated ferredoxin
MIICHCFGISDRHLEEALDGRADPKSARDLRDFLDASRAGTACGGCLIAVCALDGQARQTQEPERAGCSRG